MKRKFFSDTETILPTSRGGSVGLSEERNNSTNPWTFRPYSSRYYDILAKRKQLPVYEFKNALEVAVRDNQVVIIEGETGSGQYLLDSEKHVSPTIGNTYSWQFIFSYNVSGKTTQIPQFLLPMLSKFGQIACTQPRRVAAMSIAKRVSDEMDVEMGRQVCLF